MDTTQILLVTVILILTVMLVVIGVQVAFVLRELRRAAEKVNRILGDAGEVSESLKRPISNFGSFLLGLKGSKRLLKWLKD